MLGDDSSCSGTASAIDDVGEGAPAGVKRKRAASSDDDEDTDVDSDCELLSPPAIFGKRGRAALRRRIQHQCANAVWHSQQLAGMRSYLKAHQVEGEYTELTMTQLERLTEAWEAEKGIDLGPEHRALQARHAHLFRLRQKARAVELGLESRFGPWPPNVESHNWGWSRSPRSAAERR